MKTKSLIINYCVVLLCTLFFFFLNSCSKDAEEELTNVESVNIDADKNQYAPYEIVTFSLSENVVITKSFPAKINGIAIMVDSEEKAASFVLPKLEDGVHNLTFTANDKNYIVPINVLSLSNILAADQYFSEIKNSMNQNLTNLNSQITQLQQNSANPQEYENLKNDAAKYTNLLANYTTSYNNLSSVEKLEFAKAMAANKSVVTNYNNLTLALHSSIANLKSAQSIQNYEKGVETSKATFTASVQYTVSHIPFILAGAQLATSINPWVSGGAILATGIVAGNFMVNVCSTACAGVALTTKAIKPFEFIMQSTPTIYTSGEPAESDVQVKYRSLIDSDANNSGNGSTINEIVEKYNYLMDKYNNFVNKIPSIFKPSYIITSLKNTFKSTTRSLFNSYISFTNVSNPNVTLQKLSQTDGSTFIKATTTATTDQAFTYNVNYTNSNFTNGLSKTVSAKVITTYCDPNSIIGTWRVEMYNTCYPNPDGTPSFYNANTLILYQGGNSLFRYYDGTEVGGTYTKYDCSFTYNNLSWCTPTAYAPSSSSYGSLSTCGCLSLKHIKQ